MPFERGALLSELHEVAGDLEREDTAEGVRVRARVPAGARGAPAPFELNGRRPTDPADVERPRSSASRDGARRPARRTSTTPATTCSPPRRARIEPGRASERRHRHRGRDPRGTRRTGAAALGPRRPARHRARELAGPDRRRLPRRAPRAAAEHRPRERRSRSSPATASPSSWWSRVEAPQFEEVGRADREPRAPRAASARPAADA